MYVKKKTEKKKKDKILIVMIGRRGNPSQMTQHNERAKGRRTMQFLWVVGPSALPNNVEKGQTTVVD